LTYSVVTGSIGEGAGEVKVRVIDNADLPPYWVGIEDAGLGKRFLGQTAQKLIGFLNAVDDGVNGVSTPTGYYVQNIGISDARDFEINPNVSYAPGYLESKGMHPHNLPPDLEPVFDHEGNFIGAKKIEPYCFAAGTPIDMADGSRKPIEQVKVGDFVLAYDPENANGLGDLAARRVTRTYATPDKLVLDFHGLLVTPGHVFLCGDGPHKAKHRMLIDILRDDGAVVAADGRVIRAATNALLGSREDAFLQVRYLPAGAESVHQEGRLRAGTLLLTDEGETASVLQLLEAEGYTVTDDGLVARDGEDPHALHWYGPLPRPEDYVLQVSNLTDADLSGDVDYIPDVASDGGPLLGAGWSPAHLDDEAPSLFAGGNGTPKHGGETLH
jgi:hypothetical protein